MQIYKTLEVLMAAPDAAHNHSLLESRLRKEIRGEVLFSRSDRGRYSTDASIYQVMPVGVVVPRTTEDVITAMAIAREQGVAVLPRGGGTSQCGQTVNRALVLDCSKYLRNLIEVDVAARTALVEPGIVLGHLNAGIRQHGLFFPVDPSTHSRCTIGGLAANNSCGSKSIRYGLMADNVRAIDAVLADGTRYRFGPGWPAPEDGWPDGVGQLLARLAALGDTEAGEIAQRFPKVLRRVGGYNIDALTPEARRSNQVSLARLLVGSEGTLAYSAALELTLQPIKPRKVLGICQFPSFRAAMEAARHLVTLDPEAVELVDRTMIDLGRSIPIYRKTIDDMLIGEPESLLIVEFHGFDDATLLGQLDRLEEMMKDFGLPATVVRATNASFQADIARVREAGLNIMMSMKGDGKPISFIEDTAVPLEELADYTERLNTVFERHGTRGTWYAHASVGCLHVRPVLSMKDPADVSRMRKIAEECFALVREYKGSHSGEHGDGIARSEFHEQMFGARIVQAFETVKDAFDPKNLFNPNRIVRPPNFDDRRLFRYFPEYGPASGFAPQLDWSAHPGPLGGMLGAVEMCNNNGQCRSFDAGVMCPSYRVTLDEQQLTRGRANTVRLALSGQLGADALADDEVYDAMRLCVSCKACRRECPTGIDMAKMKIEVLAARAAKKGIGVRDHLVAEMPRYAALASTLAPVANLRNGSPLLRRMSRRLAGLAEERPLPVFRRDYFRDSMAKTLGGGDAPRGDVILFVDTFNRYFEPENVWAALKVIAAAGYHPILPRSSGRPLCCGRTYLSAGMVDRARAEAKRTVEALAGDMPVLGLEPSCLLTMRDEFRSLLPGEASAALSERALLLSEWLVRAKISLPLAPIAATAHVHGHCHQKSFGAFDDTLAALGMVPKMKVESIASSCCGMAGAFGYQVESQQASRAMAEASLLPAVRRADEGDFIVADGTSCRHQIADLSGREAMHSVRVLAAQLIDGTKGAAP
jgi:FAD/FMN-containing dehydrogenase/Fe-S oxidoreductase